MSSSVKSWLFSHCASGACDALEGGYDLGDLPIVAGNRVQVLRFMTFRSVEAPSRGSDVWALVGDRTHCIAARFARSQVDRFQAEHPLTLTALKGALLTLTHVKLTIARVQIHAPPNPIPRAPGPNEPTGPSGQSGQSGGSGGSGLPYRAGQYAMILDVRGFEVVSSLCEPVWFGGVKLVSSTNAVPPGEERRAEAMRTWIRRWIRYKCLLRRARLEHRNRRDRITHQPQSSQTHQASAKITEAALPTPGQRRRAMLVPGSSQNAPTVVASLGWKDTQSTDVTPDASTAAMWKDFDLDVSVDVELDVPSTWQPLQQPEQPQPLQCQPDKAKQSTQQSTSSPTQQPQTQTQMQTQSGSDPDESGLSDYERDRRRVKRQRRTHAQPAPSQPSRPDKPPNLAPAKIESPPPTSTQRSTSSTSSRRKRKLPPAIAAL